MKHLPDTTVTLILDIRDQIVNNAIDTMNNSIISSQIESCRQVIEKLTNGTTHIQLKNTVRYIFALANFMKTGIWTNRNSRALGLRPVSMQGNDKSTKTDGFTYIFGDIVMTKRGTEYTGNSKFNTTKSTFSTFNISLEYIVRLVRSTKLYGVVVEYIKAVLDKSTWYLLKFLDVINLKVKKNVTNNIDDLIKDKKKKVYSLNAYKGWVTKASRTFNTNKIIFYITKVRELEELIRNHLYKGTIRIRF